MTALAVVPKRSSLATAVRLALDSVVCADTKRKYSEALVEFVSTGLPFNRAGVHAWRAHLIQHNLAPATINRMLSAVRKLAREAAASGYFDGIEASAIEHVENVRLTGNRAGNWLTADEAQELIEAPSPASLNGKRDRCALALLVGCALRRSEAAKLTFEHIQQRDGRWVIVDLIGKRNRIRTVAVPSWVKAAIDRWSQAAGISTGRILRAMHRNGKITHDSISDVAVYDLAARYGREIGVELKAHDLRRTCAKLARKNGGKLEQIQIMLGHASIQTTERYLGTTQDLEDAPNDHLGLRGRSE